MLRTDARVGVERRLDLADETLDLLDAKGFGEQTDGAGAVRLLEFLARAGDHDDPGIGVEPADDVDDVEAVHDRHVDVHEDDVGMVLFVEVDRFNSVLGDTHDLLANGVERFAKEGADSLVVIHHKNFHSGFPDLSRR